MGIRARVIWWIRRGLWNGIARIKFKNNEPLAILPIPRSFDEVVPVPFRQQFSDVRIPTLQVAWAIPSDEQRPRLQYAKKTLLFTLQRWLYRWFPPMQQGLPSIDSDPQVAMKHGYRRRHDRVAQRAAETQSVPRELTLRRPILPIELQGSPDLGQLAVRGPYAGYLQRVAEDEYEWNLDWSSKGSFTCHQGLYRPWAHVRFHVHRGDGVEEQMHPLRATEIRTELGTARPIDPQWPMAQRIALCAVSTHTGLVRHWNWLHLMAGESFAMATRQAFQPDHPLCRLLWPHIYGTQQSNRFGNMAQLVPQGDFEQIYSFTHDGMCEFLEVSAKEFCFEIGNPKADAVRRGLTQQGIDLPTQRNEEALYEVIHRHVERYVGLYYDQDTTVQNDRAILRWGERLQQWLPHANMGLKATVASLTDTIAGFIYFVTVYHESVGALLWNYQMWTGIHPIRVYRDGRREPLDVYQRLVNTNYLLHVIRAPLMDDYSGVALVDPQNPSKGKAAQRAFEMFREELRNLQQVMDQEPWGYWKLYPNRLEVNINA